MKKSLSTGIILSGLLIGGAGISQARARAWIVINPFPIIVAPPPPVVVEHREERREVVPDAYAVPPRDYRRVLTDFHDRVRRLQKVLDRQLSKRIITQRQYDRHADDLDAIIHEEQQDAARHNGSLTPPEVNDLDRRLTELQDRIHEDLAR